jgi:hypothetical protein
MSSIQTLYDVLFAVVFLIGISAALALTATAAGAVHQRQQLRTAMARSARMAPLQQQASNQDARELNLR